MCYPKSSLLLLIGLPTAPLFDSYDRAALPPFRLELTALLLHVLVLSYPGPERPLAPLAGELVWSRSLLLAAWLASRLHNVLLELSLLFHFNSKYILIIKSFKYIYQSLYCQVKPCLCNSFGDHSSCEHPETPCGTFYTGAVCYGGDLSF